jgi:hypothetical protein
MSWNGVVMVVYPCLYQLILLWTPPSSLLLGWVWLTNVFSQALLAREKPFLCFYFFSYVSPGTKEWRECVHLLPSARLSIGTLTALCAWQPFLLPIASHPDYLLCAVSTTLPHFFLFLFRRGVFTVNATDGTNDYITCLRDHSTSSNLAITNVRPAYLSG